jgi:hypothetical protein
MNRIRRGLLTGAAITAATAAVVMPLASAPAGAATHAGHEAGLAGIVRHYAPSTGGRLTAGTNFIVNTKSYAHYDTTNFSGNATLSSPNGPVWAMDSLNEHWVAAAYAVTPTDGANYSVTLTITSGSKFSEFADPNTGNVGVGTGKVFGVLQYDIQSSTPPSAANVPPIQAPNTGLGAVLDQIFGAGNYSIVGGGNYYFRYLKVAGVEYDQSSCTGTPHIPAGANTPAC